MAQDSTDFHTSDAFTSPEEFSRGLIRKIRDALQINQTEFGELIGCHYVTVSKIENANVGLPDGLRAKLLILHELITVPGVADLLRYTVRNHTGNDAFFLSLAVHKVVAHGG